MADAAGAPSERHDGASGTASEGIIDLKMHRGQRLLFNGAATLGGLVGLMVGLTHTDVAIFGRVVMTAAGITFGFMGCSGLRVALSPAGTVAFRSDGLTFRHPYFTGPLIVPWSGVHSVWAHDQGWSAPGWGSQRRIIDLTRVNGPGRFNLLVVLVPELDLRSHVRFGANFIGNKMFNPISAAGTSAGLCGIATAPHEVPRLMSALGRPTADAIPPDVAEWLGRAAIPVN